jgi:four helix bundle protein
MNNEKLGKENILRTKSYAFALRIVKLNQFLNEQKEYILSKQVLRSGTAIGALIRESEFAQSRADFVNKLSIALKEANETEYWLSLLKDGTYITDTMHTSIQPEVEALIKLLVTSIKTAKSSHAK